MEIEIQEENTKVCNMCKEEPASATQECLTCEVHACDSCSAAHLSNPRFAQHKLIALESKFFCKNHSQEMVLFCIDDKRAVCVTCAKFSHNTHRVLDFTSALEILKPQISDLQSQLSNSEESLTTKTHELETQKTKLESQCSDMLTQMNSSYEKLKSVLDQEFQAEKENISKKYQQEKLFLEEKLTKTQETIQILDQLKPPKTHKAQLDFLVKSKEALKSLPVLDKPKQHKFPTEFVRKAQMGLDCLCYSDTSFSSRWACRSCNSKNFPKDFVCRKCKTPNHLIALVKPKH